MNKTLTEQEYQHILFRLEILESKVHGFQCFQNNEYEIDITTEFSPFKMTQEQEKQHKVGVNFSEKQHKVGVNFPKIEHKKTVT